MQLVGVVVLSAALVTVAGCSSYADAPSNDSSPTSAAAPSIPGAECAAPYPSPPITVETVFCADPAGMQTGRVLRIVDGDTLHVDLGGVDETVRLYGVDTPERGDACFNEATEALQSLAGERVSLLRDARNRDRSGRLLRYVYAPDGRSIDADLIGGGFAVAWTDDGALRDPLVALERQAQAGDVGCLWTD